MERLFVQLHSRGLVIQVERRDKMNCIIKSLYLCVKDMNRAIDFYENLFEQTVTVRDEIYSVFDINGFSSRLVCL